MDDSWVYLLITLMEKGQDFIVDASVFQWGNMTEKSESLKGRKRLFEDLIHRGA